MFIIGKNSAIKSGIMNTYEKALHYGRSFLISKIRKARNQDAVKQLLYQYRRRFILPDSIRHFQEEKTVLSSVEEGVVKQLKKEGIAIINFQKLLSSSLYKELDNYLEQYLSSDQFVQALESGGNSYKQYIIMRHKFDKSLNDQDILFKIGTSDPILNIVNQYLGCWSKAIGMDLWYTQPSKLPQRVFSQNWHRDPEESKIVKVFLYLNDVDEESGPFSYIRESHYNGKYAHLWPKKYPFKGIYPKDEEVLPQIDPSDILKNTGKKGTLIFCDTNGLHRGGFGKKVRILGNWVYAPPSSISRKRHIFSTQKNNIDSRTRYLIS